MFESARGIAKVRHSSFRDLWRDAQFYRKSCLSSSRMFSAHIRADLAAATTPCRKLSHACTPDGPEQQPAKTFQSSFFAIPSAPPPHPVHSWCFGIFIFAPRSDRNISHHLEGHEFSARETIATNFYRIRELICSASPHHFVSHLFSERFDLNRTGSDPEGKGTDFPSLVKEF